MSAPSASKSTTALPESPPVRTRLPEELGTSIGGTASSTTTAKQKQSKSRNGCTTCKAKRLKCDESKPHCQQCRRRRVPCGGYQKDFKWRAFGEATFKTGPNFKARNNGKGGTITESEPKAALSIPTGRPGGRLAVAGSFEFAPQIGRPDSPSPTDIAGSILSPTMAPLLDSSSPYGPLSMHLPSGQHLTSNTDLSPRLQNPPSPWQRSPLWQSFPPVQHTLQEQHIPQWPPSWQSPPTPSYILPDPSSLNLSHPARQGSSQVSLPASSHLLQGLPPIHDANLDHSSWMAPVTNASTRPTASGRSPSLADLLLLEDISVDSWFHQDSRSSPKQASSQTPSSSPPVHEMMPPDDDDVEEVVRAKELTIAPWLMRAFAKPSIFLTDQPKLHSWSPEMLIRRYDQDTCGILSLKDGPTENPWRTLVRPLAQNSPALYHAISCLAAFHTTDAEHDLKTAGLAHLVQSQKYLARDLNTMSRETALATSLVLAFAESWDVQVSTGIQYVRGIRNMTNETFSIQNELLPQATNNPTLKFLWNTLTYVDVIARLTSVDEGFSGAAAASWPLSPPPSLATELDPLMGFATQLFPIIGHVATLVREVRITAVNTPALIARATELQAQLAAWAPPIHVVLPEDPMSPVEDSLQTAQAYRWATRLYLHQAVPEAPAPPIATLAFRTLAYLASVPLRSRSIIVHIYPLLTAGCEAETRGERTWVQQRWIEMSRRMSIGNIDRCLQMVKEVWRRRDERTAKEGGLLELELAEVAPLSKSRSTMWMLGEEGDQYVVSLVGDGTAKYTPVEQTENDRERARVEQDVVQDVMFERTVRGPLHWVGVMTDWHWEVLLG